MHQLFADHPELQALYERHLADEQLLDMRPVFAQVKALADWMVGLTAQSSNDDPAILAHAIQSLRQVMTIAHDLLRIEDKLGPISHADLRRLVDAFAKTLRTFVDPDRYADALAYFRERATHGG